MPENQKKNITEVSKKSLEYPSVSSAQKSGSSGKQKSKRPEGFKTLAAFSLFLSLLVFFSLTSGKVSAQQGFSGKSELLEKEQTPPQKLIQELTGFFKDIKAEVLSIDGGNLRIGAGLRQGMKQYMRFDIVTTKKIKHPVTEEEIWTGDIKTARVEIVRVEEDFSEGRVIEGTAEPGSRILLSKAPLKVYVQEEKAGWSNAVDYFIVNDYISELKKTGRFEIVNDKSLSDIMIILSIKDEIPERSSSTFPSGTNYIAKLLQKALWSQTEELFFESAVELQRDYIERLKKDWALYEGELKSSDLLLSFRLPGSVRFINIADIEGDGKEELIIAKDSYIEVYSIGITLKGLHEIKIKGEPLGLYSADINGDGKTEIIVPVLQDDKATSRIYELRDGEFTPIYKETGLIRYVSGKLFIQDYSPYDGPRGEIKELKLPLLSPLVEKTKPEALSLKYGYDIFSFVFVCNESRNAGVQNLEFLHNPPQDCMTLAYDDRGYLYLYDKEGKLLWRSEKDTGGFFSTFKKARASPLLQEEEWTIKDRVIVEGAKIYLIRRTPVSGIARGIGWSSSAIVSIRWDGRNMIEETIKEIGGTVVDFYLTKDRLYVLQKPFMGISLGSLLKGENPKQTRLYIFKRR